MKKIMKLARKPAGKLRDGAASGYRRIKKSLTVLWWMVKIAWKFSFGLLWKGLKFASGRREPDFVVNATVLWRIQETNNRIYILIADSFTDKRKYIDIVELRMELDLLADLRKQLDQ